jgi:hypothetical protein
MVAFPKFAYEKFVIDYICKKQLDRDENKPTISNGCSKKKDK